MTSTKSIRWKPGTKWASTSAFTVPKVVSGRSLKPSVKASRIRRLKTGRGCGPDRSSFHANRTAVASLVSCGGPGVSLATVAACPAFDDRHTARLPAKVTAAGAAPRLSCGQAISGTRRCTSANSKSHSSSTSAATSWLPVALILSNWSRFRSLASTLSKVAEATPRPNARSYAKGR